MHRLPAALPYMLRLPAALPYMLRLPAALPYMLRLPAAEAPGGRQKRQLRGRTPKQAHHDKTNRRSPSMIIRRDLRQTVTWYLRLRRVTVNAMLTENDSTGDCYRDGSHETDAGRAKKISERLPGGRIMSCDTAVRDADPWTIEPIYG
jgi:hypothetical protein